MWSRKRKRQEKSSEIIRTETFQLVSIRLEVDTCSERNVPQNRTQCLFCRKKVLTDHQTAHERQAHFVNLVTFDEKKLRGRSV